MTDLVYFYNQS